MVQAVPNNTFPTVAVKKLALPLDEYIDFKHGQYSNPVYDVSLCDGKHYGVFWNFYHEAEMILMYNKTMLESQTLENPLDMMLQSRWDWDMFLDYAQKCTRDIDGDGMTDVWGLMDSGDIAQLLYAFIFSNGGAPTEKVNGKDIYALNSQKSIEAIDFMLSLYKEHKVVMDSATIYNHASNISQLSYDDFTKNGKGAFYIAKSVLARGAINNTKFETVMFPKGRSFNKYVSYAAAKFIMIPSSVKNPEQIAEIMELVFSIGDDSKEMYYTFDKWADNYINSSNNDNRKEAEDFVEMMKIINNKSSKDTRTMVEDLKIPVQDEIDKLWQ